MATFMVTFGQRHPLKDYWIEVEALDEQAARKTMLAVFGSNWAFIYEKEGFNSEYFPGGKVGKTLRE